MHPFDSVLSAMRLESSLFVRMRAHAPWAISFDSGGQARLVVVAKGRGWFTQIGHPPVVVRAGDCLIIRHRVEGILGDAPDRVAVPCWRIADNVTGETVAFGGGGDACEFFSTLFTFDHAAGEPLSALLPDVVHVAMPVSDAGRMVSILEHIGAEEAQGSLGGSYVIGRLLDVLFIQAIRTWATSDGSIPEGWLAGLTHPQLARTLQRIHADLAHPWTLEQLARDAAMSRSSFAALFKSVVGVPPLTYITTWRIYRAKRILAAGHSIAAAAGQTGYGSDIALSRAFKAATGVAPGRWRRQRRAAGRNGPGPDESAALGLRRRRLAIVRRRAKTPAGSVLRSDCYPRWRGTQGHAVPNRTATARRVTVRGAAGILRATGDGLDCASGRCRCRPAARAPEPSAAWSCPALAKSLETARHIPRTARRHAAN